MDPNKLSTERLATALELMCCHSQDCDDCVVMRESAKRLRALMKAVSAGDRPSSSEHWSKEGWA